MKRLWQEVLLVAAALGIVTAGQGTALGGMVIYDNGGADLHGFIGSDFQLPQRVADHFVLSQASVLTGVQWSGVYAFGNSAPQVDDFTIRLYQDAGGLPANDFFYEFHAGNVPRVATGQQVVAPAGRFDVFSYSTNVAPVSLSPGSTLWLSIVDNTPNSPNNQWFWATSSAFTGSSTFRFFEGFPWNHYPAEEAFSLTGEVAPVPEPSSLSLAVIAGGMGIVAWVRRRRAKAG
jgi:hypothetical protein